MPSKISAGMVTKLVTALKRLILESRWTPGSPCQGVGVQQHFPSVNGVFPKHNPKANALGPFRQMMFYEGLSWRFRWCLLRQSSACTSCRWRRFTADEIVIGNLLIFLLFPDVKRWIYCRIWTTEFVKSEFVKRNKMDWNLPVEYYRLYF